MCRSLTRDVGHVLDSVGQCLLDVGVGDAGIPTWAAGLRSFLLEEPQQKKYCSGVNIRSYKEDKSSYFHQITSNWLIKVPWRNGSALVFGYS
jgi:hypothetical protein